MERWLVYNAQTTSAFEVGRNRMIHVPLGAVHEFIKLTHNIHFHFIAIDQGSIEKHGSMDYMLGAFLNFRSLTSTIVYL
ncbi:hypothetical protein LPJ75_004534 [Coemansia sp. RSA 2598]|nr:hypothetical protein LPJ75_004534 [Coemansia sp. RSA 2598]